jgi:transmembrane 9 superfamily protein 2/4
MARRVITVLCFLLYTCLVNGFYLPGAAPRTFKAGERVELFVNALTPMMTNEDYGVVSALHSEIDENL